MRRMLAAIALLAFSPAFAADAPPEADKSGDKPICHREAPATGSTLPGKRVCKTAAEWRAQALAEKRSATPAFMPSGMQQEPLTTR